jgi:hypothetical protein
MKRICAVLAILAVGVVGGFLGQAAGAQAGAAHLRTVTSDKAIYATWDGGIDRTDTGSDFWPSTLLRIHLTVPSAGTAAIEFDTGVYSNFNGGLPGAHEMVNQLELWRCTTVATHASPGRHCQSLNLFTFAEPGDFDVDSTQPYTQSMIARFSAGGSRTIFINAQAQDWMAGFTGHLHVQVQFTPAHPIATSAHASVSIT